MKMVMKMLVTCIMLYFNPGGWKMENTSWIG